VQRLLDPPAVGDVLDLGDEAAVTAVVLTGDRDGEVGPDGVAVAMAVALVQLEEGDLTGEQAPHLLDAGVQVVGMGERLEVAREQLVGAVADQRAQRRVDL
jgi:hypothetical protein